MATRDRPPQKQLFEIAMRQPDTHGRAMVFVRRHGAPVPRTAVRLALGLAGEAATYTLPHDRDNVYMGHVGWAFSVGSSWWCGSLENLSGNPVTTGPDASVSASYWYVELVASEQSDAVNEMRTLAWANDQFGLEGSKRISQYDAYKIAYVTNPDYQAAIDKVEAWGRGSIFNTTYTAVFQNCLDCVYSILDAYGVRGQPYGALTPNWFFDNFNGDANAV